MLNVLHTHRRETHSDELSLKPGFVLDGVEAGELTPRHVNHTVMHIWVLGGGVVAPDDHVLHMGRRNTATHCHLQKADEARRPSFMKCRR